MARSVVSLGALAVVLVVLKLHSCTSPWTYVRRVTAAHASACSRACVEDLQCTSWQFFPATVAAADALQEDVDALSCVLMSATMADIMHRVPEAFAPTADASIEGVREQAKNFTASVERVIDGPIATSGNTVLSSAQHFVRGCSYTVALWVWLWKPRRHVSDREYVIFATRPSSHHGGDVLEPVLPAVIFNTRLDPTKLFFSITRDTAGDYSGYLTSVPVRYHEWMHVALTVTHTRLAAIVNGEVASSIIINPPHMEPRACPYALYRSGRRFNATDPADLLRTSAWRDATVPNTVFQVRGPCLG
jgi:hypothetical protein